MSALKMNWNMILEIRDPRGRVRRYRGHNTVTDYGLFLFMNIVFGGIAAPKGSGTPSASLPPTTRYNDGVNVYPSLYDLGGNTNLNAYANPWNPNTVSGQALTSNPYYGLFGANGGLILVATNDSTSPSETQFTWPSGTTCLWTSSATTVSTSSANDKWTTTGSQTGATPPQATFVLTDSATAISALTIQSVGWTAPFLPGSVSGNTAPTVQPNPTPAWTSSTPTSIANWPIISKVIPSGAPISVAAGSTMAITYIFTVTT
jgi:hypothetical protein